MKNPRVVNYLPKRLQKELGASGYKKPRVYEESGIARNLVTWFQFAHKGLGVPDERLLVHVPNGGKMWKAKGGILKAEGVRPGFPDYVLFVPRGGYQGLCLELKAKAGVVSPDQKEMMKLLEAQGYLCAVAFDFNQVYDVVTKYLGLANVILDDFSSASAFPKNVSPDP